MAYLTEQKTLPYSNQQMFDLVSDVGRYPEFLPWCVGARIYNKKAEQFDADVIIGFKMFREKFTSRVVFQEPHLVEVDYITGPMKRLYNHWRFTELEQGGCHINFEVDFEFQNRVLEQMIGKMLVEASERMIDAFETRAHELYGA